MQVVGQVSLPMRIALVATLAFSAIWFVALRPKPPAADPATPAPAAQQPAQSAPGKAAEQAQQAVGASQQSAAKHETAAGNAGTDAAPTPSETAKTLAPGGDPDRASGRVDLRKAAGTKTSKAALSVLGDVVDGKVAVLLFWDRRLSDDRAVHSAVMSLDRRGGKVAIHKAPIGKLAEFEPITSGVPVVTSPTVLIIDRAGRARSVGGLTVPGELDELVGKALRVKP